MAEKVKRRVAAARLAVAFAAAATIAGATAWAQPGPPDPSAQSSAFDAFLKINSSNVVDGSLLFEDFNKFEVPSYKQFHKNEVQSKHFQKVVFNRYYPKVEIDRLFIKGESNDYIKRSEISSYLKRDEADARYVKLTDSVVQGDGSVFTASKLVDPQAQTPLVAVPGMFTVDAQGPVITFTNTSGGELGPSSCTGVQGAVGPGTLQPGQSISCDASAGSTESIQFFSWGELGAATVSFSSLDQAGTPFVQDTVQILVGL